ncbi:hypothetical protein ACJJTC_015126 [Scirpophaga incertulas]
MKITPKNSLFSLYFGIRSTHAHNPGSPGTLNGVNGSVHGEARQAQSRKTIIRMLAAVVVAFFVCWAPFHFQRLFFIYGTSSPHYHTINKHLFSVAGAFYYVSATVNPILYNLMSHRYRIAFKETLCCKSTKKQSKYREHSSIRETTVNHTSDGGHLVRVRSHSQERRNRIDHKVFRRCSYYGTETTSLCSAKWKEYYKDKKALLNSERNSANSSPSNNNDSKQVIFNEKDDYKVNPDLIDDSNININISIHLHK